MRPTRHWSIGQRSAAAKKFQTFDGNVEARGFEGALSGTWAQQVAAVIVMVTVRAGPETWAKLHVFGASSATRKPPASRHLNSSLRLGAEMRKG